MKNKTDIKPRAFTLIRFVLASLLAVLLASQCTLAQQSVTESGGHRSDDPVPPSNEIRFMDPGYTIHGEWYGGAGVRPTRWRPGQMLKINARLLISDSHLSSLTAAGIKVDGFCLLITAERTFDAEGRLRLPSDERMSTLLTPTGLAIEGGVQGAVTNRFGYGYKTPVDEFLRQPLSAEQQIEGLRQVSFEVQPTLPGDLPPGIYRLRLDWGVTAAGRYYNLNGETFASRPFFKGRPTESHQYSPPIPASGKDVAGRDVDASRIRPRIPWVLLNNYNSNGYRGVVAEEDSGRFALSNRNLIPDDVILPLYDDNNNRLSYSLEPQFPTDTIEARNNIVWDCYRGEISIQIKGPDGKTTDLGTSLFVGQSGQWPTTKKSAITAWKPPLYGQYTVVAKGWTSDSWGNRYEGGGTYKFWIAKRMTLATATFQGFAYPVGNRYGRDLGFAPAVPADVEIKASLFVDSDPATARTVTCSGKASLSGIFGAAQGMKPLPFDAPGEYLGHVLAKYVDRDGHLWICSMRHAGVVYAEDSSIVARGKKLQIGGKYVDRGETRFEGHLEPDGTGHLHHINYPFLPGDVLLIASEQHAANKIEPVLNYDIKDKPMAYDTRLSGVGRSNLQLRTSNGYSPHLYPEYITEWAYYYSGAPRPGFMSRFLVGEDGVRAPYWHVSPNNFGGQINASNNGDLPGDIYRLIGGIVLRRKNQAPAYAGYLASAFILPPETNNNRVVAAGSEDLIGSDGTRARFFLVGTRPGMVYETGTSFTPAAQIDPVLPVSVKFTLIYPDGRQEVTAGSSDKFGSWAGQRMAMDVPGVYGFYIEADWQGYKGFMPGLPNHGGKLYVVEKDRPANAPSLVLNLKNHSVFSPSGALTLLGSSSADLIEFAAVIPGGVVDQGSIQVQGGQFEFRWDPAAISRRTSTYDVVNLVNGKPEIFDVVHLTFFSREIAQDGNPCHSFVRLIIRGNKVLYTR